MTPRTSRRSGATKDPPPALRSASVPPGPRPRAKDEAAVPATRMGPELEAHLRAFHTVRPEEDAPDEPPQPDIGRVNLVMNPDDGQYGDQGHVWVCTTCAWQTASSREPETCANCAGQDTFVEQEM